MKKIKELTVVIPVYNEEEIIAEVIQNWTKALEKTGASFEICVYNDGCTDSTPEILKNAALKNNYLKVHNKKNEGHGPTILKAYQDNIQSDWIFQTDSDNEMSADYFALLWNQRNMYDFLIGSRENRFQPVARKLISSVSRLTVSLFYKKGVIDVNSPFRLMRTSAFKDIIFSIPEDTFAPNVVITGMASLKDKRILEVPIPHENRKTGKVSLNKLKLVKASLNSFLQTILYRLKSEAPELSEDDIGLPDDLDYSLIQKKNE